MRSKIGKKRKRKCGWLIREKERERERERERGG